MRFKCVSKAWHALIDPLIKDREFVENHLRHSNNNIFSPSRLIFRNTVTWKEYLATDDQEQFFLLGMFNNYDDHKDRIPFVAEDGRDGWSEVLPLRWDHLPCS